jgi:hypothetical protein
MRDHADDASAAIEGYLLARGARHRDVREQQYGDAMDSIGFTGFPDLIADLIADLMHLHEATDPDAADSTESEANARTTIALAMSRWQTERNAR